MRQKPETEFLKTMEEFEQQVDFRSVRDGSPQWRGRCYAVHLPTGAVVSFSISWDNEERPRSKALERLRRKVVANYAIIWRGWLGKHA